MKKKRTLWIIAACTLVSLLFAGSTVYQFMQPLHSPWVSYRGVTLVVTPHHNQSTTPSMQVTPKTAHDGFAIPTNYEAQNIFNFLLWEHMPVNANFPHGIDFPEPSPSSFIGFSDVTNGFSHWYIIAVYNTSVDANQDYQAMQESLTDALFVSARCVLIGDKSTSQDMTTHYESLIVNACN